VHPTRRCASPALSPATDSATRSPPPSTSPSPAANAPVTWHRFDETTFNLDRHDLTVVSDLTIGLYGPARSIIDAFRLRHLYGQNQATEALKRWLREHGNHPAELLALARHFPTAEPALRRMMEILL
jgi:hypothetical protein